MPIQISDGLAAKKQLHEEGIATIDNQTALQQDIRPLRILILNLMPLKEQTELQFLRLLGDSPLQLDVDFCHMTSHTGTHTDNSYLEKNYYTFRDIQHRRYDGFIITGAPVETLPFTAVDYWPELTHYLEWAKTRVFSTLYFCWGAQAGLYYHYGIEKRPLSQKLFGIYEYGLTVRNHPLLRGFDDRYFIPQSRHTAIDDTRIYSVPSLEVLSRSEENGINITCTWDYRRIFVLGHFEYDRYTLENEYKRDRAKGADIALPQHYYPQDDDGKTPRFNWCSYAHLFYHNWLNIVYQNTPYRLQDLVPLSE